MWATLTVKGTFETHVGVPNLHQMQSTVGGYIEAVYLQKGIIMWLNEEGKLEGMPMNVGATLLAHSHAAIAGTDYIAGDVLFTGANKAGDTTGLTGEQHMYLEGRLWLPIRSPR